MHNQLAEGIKAHGYPTHHPPLPSCTNTENADFSSKTLLDDSEAVKAVITRLVQNEGKRVVVIMHSYSGLVGSNAVPEDLSFGYRRLHKLPGGRIHLFYFAAFVLIEKESVFGTFGESPNNDVHVSRIAPSEIDSST